MLSNKTSLLGRLRTAVRRLRLLLTSTVLRRSFTVAALLRRSSSLPKRRLSFNDDRTAGLTLCSDETGRSDDSGSSSVSSPSAVEEDDIDKRAEIFIANFRRQLRMERQISLQLRYCRGNSFEY